jgi:hypothetical protein
VQRITRKIMEILDCIVKNASPGYIMLVLSWINLNISRCGAVYITAEIMATCKCLKISIPKRENRQHGFRNHQCQIPGSGFRSWSRFLC